MERMAVKAGGGGYAEEEAIAQDRKLGFSLALCPGSPVIPTDIVQQNITVLTTGSTTSDASQHRGTAHTSVWKTEARNQLGVRHPSPANPAPSTSVPEGSRKHGARMLGSKCAGVTL